MALVTCARPSASRPAAGGVHLVRDAADPVTEELSLFSKRREDAADGVVRGYLLQSQLHGPNFLFVDARAIARRGNVGFGFGQDVR